jgi:AcrR family transcriptional regulator
MVRTRRVGDGPPTRRLTTTNEDRGVPETTTTRNPEATRRRILAAALSEFAAKGISGARVDRIALRSKTNKRMLYHYFGSKAGLFKAVLHQRLGDGAPNLAAAELDESERMAGLFERLWSSPDYLRLLMWEALERGARGPIEGEDIRRANLGARVDAIRDAQAEGRVDPELDPEMLVLAELAVAAYPLLFPQVTRLVTGLSDREPEFRARYLGFLEALGARFAAGPDERGRTRSSVTPKGDDA